MSSNNDGLKLTERDSCITAESISLTGLSFSDAQTGRGDRRLFVRCLDPVNQGKSCIQSVQALISSSSSSSSSPVAAVQTHTRLEHNVRSAVHEYGGGSFIVVNENTGSGSGSGSSSSSVGLIYTDFPSHKVYYQPIVDTDNNDSNNDPPLEPILIFPLEPQHAACRLADFCLLQNNSNSSNNKNIAVAAIMEDHTDPAPDKVVNSLVALFITLTNGNNNDKNKKPVEVKVQTLATGLDFYASPSYHAKTKQLAFVGWNHPNMPWDDTTLYVVSLEEEEENDLQDSVFCFAPKGDPVAIHGAAATSSSSASTTTTTTTTTSVYSPQWGKNEKNDIVLLYFLSDVSGWYNLHQWNANTNQTVNLYPKLADFAESSCGWHLGVKCYCLLDNGLIAATYTDNHNNEGSIVVLIDPAATTAATADGTTSVAAATEYGRAILPPSSISSICCCSCCYDGNDDADSLLLYFLGGGIREPISIWCWKVHPAGANVVPQPAVCIRSSLKSNNNDNLFLLKDMEPFLSSPQTIQAPSPAAPGTLRGGSSSSSSIRNSTCTSSAVGTGRCYAYYYPPNNLSSQLPPDFAPPMLVKAHGGPTACTSTTFRLDIHFWTSRGFAVLDVDYGGSTGYGKDYRTSLYGLWGVLDVQDVVAATQYCIDQGYANKDWVCIDGKSAGGYTTLAALTFSNMFRAGASLYGIGDLTALAQETHKFESRYLDRLIGPYPAAKATYDERCPVLHTHFLHAPIILLQGDDDKVVPPNQAVDMFALAQQKGLPAALVMYKGEQHGFRKSDNVKHSLLSEYYFFCHVFGFEPQKELNFDGVKINERVDI